MKTKIALIVPWLALANVCPAASADPVPRDLNEAVPAKDWPAGVSAEVERALLAQDWPRVSRLLEAVTTETPSAPLRFLKGHACLALNRNNEAVRFLRDSGRLNDSETWLAWGGDFAGRHADSPLGAYLYGDALARQQNHREAIAKFDEGLRRSPAHSLLLNARAVCHAYLGNWNEAIVDLDDAAKANPGLAEVHANRGTVNIRRSLGASGAKAAFSRALEISPGFTLAAMGLASALYGQGKWSEAEKMLEKLISDPDQGVLVEANLLLIRGNLLESLANSGADKYAGTTIDRQRFDNELAKARIAFGESVKASETSWQYRAAGDTMKDIGTGIRWTANKAEAFGVKLEYQRGMWTAKIDPASGLASLGRSVQTAGTAINDIARAQRDIAALRQQDMANHYRAAQSLATQSKLQGGVNTEDLSHGFLDKGEWGLLARFALQYPASPPVGAVDANQGTEP